MLLAATADGRVHALTDNGYRYGHAVWVMYKAVVRLKAFVDITNTCAARQYVMCHL